MNKITEGLVVSLAYVLKVDGEEVGRATAEEPLEYLHGAENIVEGLERALEGRQAGDRIHVIVPPADAYGEYDENEMDEFDLADIPDAAHLEIGALIEVEDEEGDIFEGRVVEITESSIIVDFNHEMAGKTLEFDVEVLGMREADEEELEHGHPHSLHGFYDDDGYDEEDFDDDGEEEA